MNVSRDPETPTQPDLQRVLVRYVDSHDGFHQAAELTPDSGLAAAFREIAARRREVGRRVSALIRSNGERPEAEGSGEGAAHRWWMRLREKLSDDELQAMLLECVRGETALAEALREALDAADPGSEEADLLKSALGEVEAGIEHFRTAVED